MRTALLLSVLLLASCHPAADYVQADADTYAIVAPAHAAYIQRDETLSPEEKQRRLDFLQSWRIRVELAGGKPIGGVR